MSQLDFFAGKGPRPASCEPASVDEDCRVVARRLQDWPVYLGTSSWSFPGWRGLVYARSYTKQVLARSGLAAYAHHPLLGAVGLDRTYYGPLTAGEQGAYAAQTPDAFRFVVKAHRDLTTPPEQLPAAGRPSTARFLDSGYAERAVVAPALEGFGAKLLALVFQFPPMSRRLTGSPEAFARRLAGFLGGLPREVTYAVELRNPELVVPAYFEALESTGARHCFTVHPRAASLEAQWKAGGSRSGAPLVIRWNLRRDRTYEEARQAFAPFDRLVSEDPETRGTLVRLCASALQRGQVVAVLANNKAEGSAPLSLYRLARALADELAGSPS